MKKIVTFFAIILVNLVFIFLILESGFRTWLHFTTENSSVFEAKVSNPINSAEKRTISGPITLGKLIQKSSHPARVYEFIPNIKATYLGQPFETNSFGIRSIEHSLSKPNNTKRIIGLGDSVMFGWGLDFPDSYLRILEDTLNSSSIEDGTSYEVLNFAVPGYNTWMEVSTYEHLAYKFSPDLIILHFVENDLDVPLFMSLPANLKSFNRSFAYEHARDFYRAFRNKQKSSKSLVGIEFSGTERNSKEKVLSQYRYMVGNDGFKSAIAKLSTLVCKDNIPVIILTGRLRGDQKQLVESNAKLHGFHLIEAHPTVNRYIKENDLENTTQARRKLLWLNDNDPHPNALGHQLYSEALLPKVRQILSDDSGAFQPICN